MLHAVFVPSRGTFAAALLMTCAAIALAGWPRPPQLAAAVAPPTVATLRLVGDSWHHANHLAWVIEHRRYREIEAAAAAVDRSSPYARWVPAALGLAVEQLDVTAAAYARMGMCRELARFLRHVDGAWPQGRAAMKPVSCAALACGTGNAERIEELGGIDTYRRVQQVLRMLRFTALTIEIDRAVASGDHARALASCGAIGRDGPMLSTCLAEACRAGELAIAEVLLPHADAEAQRACGRAGVVFVDGLAQVVGAGLWHANPADLVHVHPDAPANRDTGVIVDW